MKPVQFEFKFDDTRLSSYYKNKIGPIKKNVASGHKNKNKYVIRPILCLYDEESLVSYNLNSELFRFHCVRPTYMYHM